jgi:hypothetical protein
MMEDEKVAKAFLSAIIEEEVVELDFAAQEHTLRRPQKRTKSNKQKENEETFFTVCRFDFSAKISLPEGGFKTVLIELQKAKLSSDIMRFRRYLGVHYQNPNNTYGDKNNKKARQIYCIFLLAYDIGIPDNPIIYVDSRVKDSSKTELFVTNEFIQGLHHQSWIVQIDQLKRRRRNDVEQLLSIFDQENITNNHHILNINEDDFPEAYRPIIRRLRMASESEDIQIEMEMEDDYMLELLDKERLVAQQKKALDEKDKTLKKQKKALKEKDKTLKEQKKALDEQRAIIEELKKRLMNQS